MKELFREFREFVERGNLLDLAVAVLLATTFAPVVSTIVDGIFMNMVAAIFGEPDFSAVRVRIRGDAMSGTATYLEIGQVLTALVDFVSVAFLCFALVKAYNVARRPAADAPEPETEIGLLIEIRDELRARR